LWTIQAVINACCSTVPITIWPDTAFGARAIIERIEEYAVPVESVFCEGGIAEKNGFATQIYAGCTISHSWLQSGLCAWSSRFCRSHRRDPQGFPSRSSAHDVTEGIVYTPKPKNQKVYPSPTGLCRLLHEAFGGAITSAGLPKAMKDLIAIKQGQTTTHPAGRFLRPDYQDYENPHP
jgi:L-ribulokinase